MSSKASAKYVNAMNQLDLESYRAGHSLDGILIERDGDLSGEYAPFDHIEHNAQLVIVGLTPGRVQACNAWAALLTELRAGVSTETALARAKRTASFSGPMRANLLAMLDEIGAPGVFGWKQAAEFFSDLEARVHFTSAVRYPVYIRGENYSGNPNPLGHPMLRGIIDTHLAEEAVALPHALWIPLGQHAEAVLQHLIGRGLLDQHRVLVGLPHPSGANAERISYFLGRKSRELLSQKTNPVRIDREKSKLQEQIRAISQI